ncbi:MAG: hypothetical protein KIT36_01670 [Alphaproteobacteria bacterium]|nr:hypothetical protein [Alphaproteobacteria bacterium]
MSDIGLKFPWWSYLLLPPAFLADVAGWGAVALAAVVAIAWLWLGRRALDAALLMVAAVAAATITLAVVPGGPGARAIASSANFVWVAAILLPVRWLVARLVRR